MDLRADIRVLILATLPFDRSDPVVCADVSAQPLDSLLVIYHNWLSRLVKPVPRSVHLSREFVANPLRLQYDLALKDIFLAIQQGRDLRPRLSRQIVYGYVAGSSSKTADKDAMLNDWGIHHLHLGTTPDPKDPNFIERTGDLLFLIFRPTAAYVLDIFDHQSWTDREIVRVAVSNWPRLDFFIRLNSVLGSSRPINEKDHYKLRRSGINVMVEVDGCVYAGRGLISTAGTSFDSARAAHELLDRVERFENLCEREPAHIAGKLHRAGVSPPAKPEFEFVFLNDGYGVREKTTGAVLILSD